jgi:prepilin-type N-terminal cleavage/methylation domain-containing protein
MNNKAFTLVELSIVLLIIGLIIGGITAGSSLIKQAQIKSVISEVNKFSTALNSFKIQFNNIPGDMMNATTFWYDATNCPGTAGVAGGCNGNGDLAINETNSLTSNEELRAWQHLSYAGLIDGSYTGTATAAGSYEASHVPGVNCPASKFSPGGYWFRYQSFSSYAAKNLVGLGGGPVTGDVSWNPLFNPSDAYNLDLKIDDGLPLSGKIVAQNGFGVSNCYSGSSYSLTATTPQCFLVFYILN